MKTPHPHSHRRCLRPIVVLLCQFLPALAFFLAPPAAHAQNTVFAFESVARLVTIDPRGYSENGKATVIVHGVAEAGDWGSPRIADYDRTWTDQVRVGCVVVPDSGEGRFRFRDCDDSVLNVKKFGAKGDGVADDTAAIQAAINYGGSEIPVYVPFGIYRLTAPLEITHDYMTLKGDGYFSDLRVDHNGNGIQWNGILERGTRRYAPRFENFRITCTANATPENALHWVDVSYGWVEKVYVTGGAGPGFNHAIYIYGNYDVPGGILGGAFGNTFRDNELWTGPGGSWVIYADGGPGLMGGPNDLRVESCHINGGLGGSETNGGTGGILIRNCSAVRLTGNDIEGWNTNGVWVGTNVQACSILMNRFECAAGVAADRQMIRFEDHQTVGSLVLGNYMEGQGNPGGLTRISGPGYTGRIPATVLDPGHPYPQIQGRHLLVGEYIDNTIASYGPNGTKATVMDWHHDSTNWIGAMTLDGTNNQRIYMGVNSAEGTNYIVSLSSLESIPLYFIGSGKMFGITADGASILGDPTPGMGLTVHGDVISGSGAGVSPYFEGYTTMKDGFYGRSTNYGDEIGLHIGVFDGHTNRRAELTVDKDRVVLRDRYTTGDGRIDIETGTKLVMTAADEAIYFPTNVVIGGKSRRFWPVDWANVKDFGAKGDGVTDDTAAFRAALQTATANSLRTVHVPGGTYIISGDLPFVSGLMLKGDGSGTSGSVLSATTNGGTWTNAMLYGRHDASVNSVLQHVLIEDVCIDMNSVPAHGIFLLSPYDNVVVSRVAVREFATTNSSLRIEPNAVYGSIGQGVTIRDFYAERQGTGAMSGAGIYLNNLHESQLINVKVFSSTPGTGGAGVAPALHLVDVRGIGIHGGGYAAATNGVLIEASSKSVVGVEIGADVTFEDINGAVVYARGLESNYVTQLKLDGPRYQLGTGPSHYFVGERVVFSAISDRIGGMAVVLDANSSRNELNLADAAVFTGSSSLNTVREIANGVDTATTYRGGLSVASDNTPIFGFRVDGRGTYNALAWGASAGADNGFQIRYQNGEPGLLALGAPDNHMRVRPYLRIDADATPALALSITNSTLLPGLYWSASGGGAVNNGLTIRSDATKPVMNIWSNGVIIADNIVHPASLIASDLDDSAVLQLNSTSKGFAPPRLTQEQMLAIQSPLQGLIIYNLTAGSLYIYKGSSWTDVDAMPNIGIDDVSGLQDALDDKSDVGHTHSISIDDVSGLQDALDDKSDVGHTHAISINNVSGLQDALDDKSDVGHTHNTNTVSGFLPLTAGMAYPITGQTHFSGYALSPQVVLRTEVAPTGVGYQFSGTALEFYSYENKGTYYKEYDALMYMGTNKITVFPKPIRQHGSLLASGNAKTGFSPGDAEATETARNGKPVIRYSSASEEHWHWILMLPAGYASSSLGGGDGLAMNIHWVTSGDSGDVRWVVRAQRLTGRDIDADAWATSASVVSSASATAGTVIKANIPNVYSGGASGGEAIEVDIFREPIHASDTLNSDAEILAIELLNQ